MWPDDTCECGTHAPRETSTHVHFPKQGDVEAGCSEVVDERGWRSLALTKSDARSSTKLLHAVRIRVLCAPVGGRNTNEVVVPFGAVGG